MFVVAPLSLLRAGWLNDCQKFNPDLKVVNFHDDKTISPHYDILVVNFEGLLAPKNMAILSKEIEKGPWMIVVDESSRMKNFKSKTTKAILDLAGRFRYRVIMSGTPAPNSEMEYWAQAEFLKPGIFGGNFYKFRNQYFHLHRNGQVQQGQLMTRYQAREIFSKGWKYGISKSSQARLMAALAPISSRLKKVDCLDLPEQIDETREVEMTPAQKKAYKQMKNELITEIKGKAITASVALTKYLKLREITSGFLYDDLGAAHTIPGTNPKINELLDVIEEADHQQIIIWAVFKRDIQLIVEELSKIAPTGALYSETSDRNETIQNFLDGKTRYLVAHPKSAAHGLTLHCACTMIFFSLDYSWESYEQARARIHRAGQTKKCTYINLPCSGTIDEDILSVLKRKGDAQELLWNLK